MARYGNRTASFALALAVELRMNGIYAARELPLNFSKKAAEVLTRKPNQNLHFQN